MKYAVDVTIEIELEDGTGEEAAAEAVDELLQRAWDTDRGRKYLPNAGSWHFEMASSSANRIDETTSVDEAVEEDLRLIRKFNDDATTD